MPKIKRQFKKIDDEELKKEAPQMTYRDAVRQDDHDEAFAIYFRERSLSKVSEKIGIPRATLHNWRKKYKWEDRIKEIDSKSRVKIDKSLEKMNEFHTRAFRFVQLRAFQELKDGKHVKCPTCKKYITECPHCAEDGIKTILPGKLMFKSVGEAAKVLENSIKGERLVSGLTTSNVGVSIIQNLSDEFMDRLGVALGRMVQRGFVTDFLVTKIVNEFSQTMNERPITVGQLKEGKKDDAIEAEYEDMDE
jgi:transposase-like protein